MLKLIYRTLGVTSVPKIITAVAGAYLLTGTVATLTYGGGYNNLTNYPSTDNRPQLSANTLSWIGPVGGGPSTTGDVAQTRALTNSGGFTTSSNGQTIEGLKFSGPLIIQHNNVTVRQCAFVMSNQSAAIDLKNANRTGIIIEDCYFNGNKTSYEGIRTFSGCSFVATTASAIRRNFMSGYENHITLWCGGDFNMTIRDNYLTAAGNTGNASYDGDMIEFYECSNVLCVNNTFDGLNSQTTSIILNALINLSNLGDLDVDINANLFANCGTVNVFVICDDNGFGGAFTWTFTDNGFFNRGGKDFRRGDTTAPSANTGNFTAATATSHSGTLINSGSGAI